jgi:hypothetical protein
MIGEATFITRGGFLNTNYASKGYTPIHRSTREVWVPISTGESGNPNGDGIHKSMKNKVAEKCENRYCKHKRCMKCFDLGDNSEEIEETPRDPNGELPLRGPTK